VRFLRDRESFPPPPSSPVAQGKSLPRPSSHPSPPSLCCGAAGWPWRPWRPAAVGNGPPGRAATRQFSSLRRWRRGSAKRRPKPVAFTGCCGTKQPARAAPPTAAKGQPPADPAAMLRWLPSCPRRENLTTIGRSTGTTAGGGTKQPGAPPPAAARVRALPAGSVVSRCHELGVSAWPAGALIQACRDMRSSVPRLSCILWLSRQQFATPLHHSCNLEPRPCTRDRWRRAPQPSWLACRTAHMENPHP
jgi:hypothetical protein